MFSLWNNYISGAMRRGAQIELNTLVFKSCTNYLSHKQNLERRRKIAKQKKNKKKWKNHQNWPSADMAPQSVLNKASGARSKSAKEGRRGNRNEQWSKMIKKGHGRWCKIDKETCMILTIPVLILFSATSIFWTELCKIYNFVI